MSTITGRYERGIEFDPADVAPKLAEITQVVTGHPAYEGHTLAQQHYVRWVAERERRKKVPDWFSARDRVWELWAREAAASG